MAVKSVLRTLVNRPSTRGIIDFPFSPLSDILLHKSDLPPKDPDYLRLVEPEYFRNKYGEAKRIFIYDASPKLDAQTKLRIPRRHAAVLPLEVRNFGVIPIPFILDAGAPGSLYLGSKPLQLLRDMNVIKEVISSEYPYLLKDATLRHGEMKLEPVFACAVPYPHESEEGGTLGHVCCNLLGAEALWHFPHLLQFREESLE